jgi:hypothetical protein
MTSEENLRADNDSPWKEIRTYDIVTLFLFVVGRRSHIFGGLKPNYEPFIVPVA